MGKEPVSLTRKDFQTQNDVRWCPGCGDYAILATLQRFLPDLGIAKENIVFISGIGCAARFPYYMETYGMHTVHGRAPSIATGLKLANPDLQVWIITGDGDALSIGGNHMLHLLRRNVDVKVLLFNNRIYGLTKGQYSPASEQGKVTKSTPFGSVDYPVNPAAFALGAGASFFARTVDTDVKHMTKVLHEAAQHKGTALIEILQNCVVFNDGAWEDISSKKMKAQSNLILEEGQPMLFEGGNKGVALDRQTLKTKVVDLEANPDEKANVLVHDSQDPSGLMGPMLAGLEWPAFPVPLGIFRRRNQPSYDGMVRAQLDQARAKSGEPDLHKLLHAGDVWEVEG